MGVPPTRALPWFPPLALCIKTGICLTIIGIPFGIQAIKLGIATLAPFGRTIEETSDAGSLLNMIFNIIWLLVFGWEIAVAHLVSYQIRLPKPLYKNRPNLFMLGI
ncbi:MAG: hypothetical protein F6K55_10065 [Moorea sp. SIO4A3]|nr:hypothetical protein [Moorena sp. SIO4A3]